ncbi:hypothetical protein BHE74_00041856 [Ensete ventricosum]|uniref:Uncharacterized protein n=1 Tax=Ensete ventricosum TaxID=4639 RepID=A0A445MFV2_ENSVE|nr:hypothetical protein BHE74_00041856 [Ensete ventricosum]RZR73093.1 hypothetical protein BHM03_00019888 [Ensete ventricosum]
MAVEGQWYTKNAALIPSVITLRDSKLGVISIGDWPPWNSIGVPPSKLLLKGYKKYLSIHKENWMITRLFIGLLNSNS